MFMLTFINSVPLIHKPVGEEVSRKQKIADAKKEMEESGFNLAIAFGMFVTVWLLRKLINKK